MNSIFSTSKQPQTVIAHRKDKTAVKEHIAKLCQTSNEIVKCQQRLDKLNFCLKKLNQLQSIRLGQDQFPMRKHLRYNENRVLIEIELTNKSLIVDNSDSYYLYTCVRFDSEYWTNKCEKLKPWELNKKHVIRLDITENINRQLYPDLVKVYLVYDVMSFLKSSINDCRKNEHEINSLNEFSVCLCQAEFRLDEFFEIDVKPDLIGQRSCEILWHIFTEYYRKFRPDFDRLEKIWTCMSFDGLPIKSLKGLIPGNNFQSNNSNLFYASISLRPDYSNIRNSSLSLSALLY